MNLYDDITTMTDEEVAEACERAAETLEGHWRTGEWFSYSLDDEVDENDFVVGEIERWAYCIEGAMAVAVGLDVNLINSPEDPEREALIHCPVYQAVTDTLNILMSREHGVDGVYEYYGEGDLPNWNDGEHGSEQKALDLLHATAKRMRGVEL